LHLAGEGAGKQLGRLALAFGGHELRPRLAEDLFLAPAEKLLGRSVPGLDQALCARDEDGFVALGGDLSEEGLPARPAQAAARGTVAGLSVQDHLKAVRALYCEVGRTGTSLLADHGRLPFDHIRPLRTRAAGRAPKAFIGCSGWSYPDWKGLVYPPDLRPKEWFAHYATLFDTVEVNTTFYQLPPPGTFSAWAAQAPARFVYALKVNRYGTHRLKLTSPERWLPAYLERAFLLGPSLGPNLVQLPPRWKRDSKRLADFLDAAQATEKATTATPAAPLRWAIELRDPSWLHESTYEVLAERGAALCWHDMLPDHPWARTAGWVYARFHGPRAPAEKYAGEYGEERLAGPASRLTAWLAEGCDVYAYFNNDQGGAAVRDARALARLLASG
jgi:uncharacterized protein YecE (DUF72 family)